MQCCDLDTETFSRSLVLVIRSISYSLKFMSKLHNIQNPMDYILFCQGPGPPGPRDIEHDRGGFRGRGGRGGGRGRDHFPNRPDHLPHRYLVKPDYTPSQYTRLFHVVGTPSLYLDILNRFFIPLCNRS